MQGSQLQRKPAWRAPWRASAALCALAAGWLGFGTAASRSAPATQPAATRPAGADPAVNPHFSATGCGACHAGGRDYFIPQDEIEALCLRCHNGRIASREPHPVGRRFNNPQITKPKGWPTPDDKLTCVTCHDIAGAGHAERKPADNPFFLRGRQPQTLLAFCGTCHVAAAGAQQRYNPHVMLDDNGQVNEAACLFCHEQGYPRETMTRTGKPALRREPVLLCVSCHNRHVEWFEPGHVGLKVSPQRAAAMAAAQGSAGEAPQRLPLAAGGTIVCSTCHNPHQRGVFPADSVLAPGATTWGKDRERLPLRGLGEGVCSGCHQK